MNEELFRTNLCMAMESIGTSGLFIDEGSLVAAHERYERKRSDYHRASMALTVLILALTIPTTAFASDYVQRLITHTERGWLTGSIDRFAFDSSDTSDVTFTLDENDGSVTNPDFIPAEELITYEYHSWDEASGAGETRYYEWEPDTGYTPVSTSISIVGNGDAVKSEFVAYGYEGSKYLRMQVFVLSETGNDYVETGYAGEIRSRENYTTGKGNTYLIDEVENTVAGTIDYHAVINVRGVVVNISAISMDKAEVERILEQINVDEIVRRLR